MGELIFIGLTVVFFVLTAVHALRDGSAGAGIDRERLDPGHTADYDGHLALAKRFVTERSFSAAREHVRRALADDPRRPEAFNLLGVLEEVAGRRLEALTQYRVALELDPTYHPAQQNLARATRPAAERTGMLRFE